MPSKPSSKHQSESSSHGSKKHGAAKSRSKSSKSDDWTDVTEPDERRRIQNRIAQRKFREKARENKERDERVANNLENAENIYRITKPEDLPEEQEDQPWGTLSWKAILARGHEAEGRRSSGQGGEYLRDERTLSSGGRYAAYPISQQPPSHGSSGGGEGPSSMFDGPSPFFYDYEYDQSGDPTQATGDDANMIPFGYQSWLQPEPQLPSDPFGPYDTASPSSSSSVSSRGMHGPHRGAF